jgi:hypothetical protein
MVALISHDPRLSILSILPLLLGGALILTRLDPQEGALRARAL